MDNNPSVTFAGGTDVGRVRKQNEDKILMSEFENSDVVLLMVADGVGGHKGGAQASKLATEVIFQSIKKSVLQANSGGGYGTGNGLEWLKQTLHNAISEANKKIIEQQNIQAELEDMATTVVALLIHHHDIVVGHLGDSRCYEFNLKGLVQITEDHTALQQLLNEGKITQKEFENLPMHNIISRALGLTHAPEVFIQYIPFDSQSLYLLCSDGLTDCVSDEAIQLILKTQNTLSGMVDELITCANDNGGVDNISVVLLRQNKKHSIE